LQVEPLPQFSLFTDLLDTLGGSEEARSALSANFARIAIKVAKAGSGHHDSKLAVHDAVALLDRYAGRKGREG
jgi:hypothetical protein